MGYNEDRLNHIYDKTNGYCHICRKKLSWANYGTRGGKGAWEVDHSVPRAKGGTHHLNNLYAACIECNNEKGTLHKSTMRKRKGYYEKPDEGCYLTSACMSSKGLPDDCHELQVLRRFRDEYISKQPNGKELLGEYYHSAPAIVQTINSRPDSKIIYSGMYQVIHQAVLLIEAGYAKKAFSIYSEMARKYQEKYLNT